MSAAIPIYPATRPIELSDRGMLLKHFQTLQPVISELSFANLYLFRHIHHYDLACINNSLTVFGSGYDGQSYFLPPLSGNREETICRLLNEGNTLYGADEQFVADHFAGTAYKLISDRDNHDYLYLREELAELPGKLFHKKKNRISYFTSRHRYSISPFSRTHLASALQLLNEWVRIHSDSSSRSIAAESAAVREGLELAGELGLTGVVVLTDSGVSAFSLGEKLNDSTYLCHFEKADPFLEGCAQLVNREFSRSLSVDFTYVNREQDLGESGLKAAKNSYHPVDMIRKYRVYRQD